MKKALFLDRDGTINVEKNYLYKIDDFEFLPGVVEALRLAQDAGFILLIITNQSGIARGYYQEEDFHTLNRWMLNTLKENGVCISQVYYCPHHPQAVIDAYKKECDCRKPGIGLFTKAIADYELDVDSCYAVGDKIRDCCICEYTSCHGFLIADHEKKETIEAVKAGQIKHVEYAENLYEAVKKIVSGERKTVCS